MTLLAQSSYFMLRTHKIDTGPLGLSCMKRSTSEPISEKNINRIRVNCVCLLCVRMCGFAKQPRFKLPKERYFGLSSPLAGLYNTLCVCVFLTMWMLPAELPSSGTHCQWRHYQLRHRSMCRWNAPGCGSSSASSHPSPWSDSRWTDAASCGLFLGPTWRVDLERDIILCFKESIAVFWQLMLLMIMIMIMIT